ncbi:MAG: hypothetical protein RMJ87_04950 [Cytophagales bacterium]|nr:hypothetical protein [Bernardetiaceae bacterium]MDW8204360.1 hypothetical protein [Cytophagales bacterium]
MQKILYNIFLFFFVVAAAQQNAVGQSTAQKLLADADSLYEQGKYREALVRYQQLVQQHRSYSLQMLAKAAFIAESINQYDEALYYLLLLYTKQQDPVLYNKIADLAMRYDLSGYTIPDEEFFIYSLQQYAYLWGSALLIIVAFITGYMLRRFIRRKSLAIVAITWAVIAFVLVYLLPYFLHAQKVIIRAEKAFIMSAPAAGAELITIAKKGTCFRMTGQKDIWCRITWNDQSAYVRCNNLWIIE